MQRAVYNKLQSRGRSLTLIVQVCLARVLIGQLTGADAKRYAAGSCLA
jgi:hypothetical protein